jgi:hypothetical protein
LRAGIERDGKALDQLAALLDIIAFHILYYDQDDYCLSHSSIGWNSGCAFDFSGAASADLDGILAAALFAELCCNSSLLLC